MDPVASSSAAKSVSTQLMPQLQQPDHPKHPAGSEPDPLSPRRTQGLLLNSDVQCVSKASFHQAVKSL